MTETTEPFTPAAWKIAGVLQSLFGVIAALFTVLLAADESSLRKALPLYVLSAVSLASAVTGVWIAKVAWDRSVSAQRKVILVAAPLTATLCAIYGVVSGLSLLEGDLVFFFACAVISILFLVCAILSVKNVLRPVPRLMIIAGVIGLPLGILAMLAAIPIRKVAARETPRHPVPAEDCSRR